ncbi:MAG: hypothetical protein Phog2KO_45190 [Phototrophicaceae bacterium]
MTVMLQSLALASGGLVSVGSITIVILLLISDKGWLNGLGYMLGYVGAYTVIGVSAVMLSYNYTTSTDTNSDSSNIIPTILLCLMGCLLLYLAFRNWRKAPSTEKKPPRLFKILDSITPIRAFAFGAMISFINVKNLAIFMSAVSVLLLSDLSLSAKILIVLLDILVFCTSVIVPVGIYLLFPNGAYEKLNWIKATLETYSRPIGIWIPLIFGFIFLVQGIRGLL